MVARLATDWPALAERLLNGGLGSVVPASLPDDHYDDVLPVIAACGNAVFAALAADRTPSYEQIRAFAEPVAYQHVEDRLPLTVLISAIHASSQVLLAQAADYARPDEMDQLVELGQRMLGVMTMIDVACIDVYAQEAGSAFDAAREVRRELCDALVGGRPAAGLAARANTTIAERYLVVTVLLDVDADETPPNLLIQRRRRTLQAGLDGLTTDIVPARFDGVEGVALIAAGSAEADPEDSRWGDLARSLADRLGVDVYVGLMEDVRPGDIPTAAIDAAELGRLARVLKRGSGAYRIDDLLLEFQVTRPSPARDRLAERVVPLFESEHLLDALHAHLQHGPDRKAAAAQVHVHPNTYTYRLRRIGELTGLNPTVPRESRMLAAALMVAGRWEGPMA
ncbi:transcriptional regulator [Gordonia iterans]|uniref:Transcriptional regulator n=1 Tax=Gordonia iterans TaxID=1004901 RepID=A0A2S0KJU7_9ACTN|nr:transcriptional regulator [Gordonia iterans]